MLGKNSGLGVVIFVVEKVIESRAKKRIEIIGDTVPKVAEQEAEIYPIIPARTKKLR